jgi:hypothetical protein
MLKLKMSTGLMREILDVGMYESQLDARYMFDGEEQEVEHCDILTNEEKEYFFENQDWDCEAYKNLVCEQGMWQLEGFFKDVSDVIKIKLVEGSGSIWSPQYYNYTSDTLDFEIEIEQSELDKIVMLVTGNEKFFKFCKRWGSYSGFHSFMPIEEDEFIESIQGKDIERALAMYLVWVAVEDCHIRLGDECNDNFSYTYWVIEYIRGNRGIGEFIRNERCLEILDKVNDYENNPTDPKWDCLLQEMGCQVVGSLMNA